MFIFRFHSTAQTSARNSNAPINWTEHSELYELYPLRDSPPSHISRAHCTAHNWYLRIAADKQRQGLVRGPPSTPSSSTMHVCFFTLLYLGQPTEWAKTFYLWTVNVNYCHILKNCFRYINCLSFRRPRIAPPSTLCNFLKRSFLYTVWIIFMYHWILEPMIVYKVYVHNLYVCLLTSIREALTILWIGGIRWIYIFYDVFHFTVLYFRKLDFWSDVHSVCGNLCLSVMTFL